MFASIGKYAATFGRLDMIERLHAYYVCGYGEPSAWNTITAAAAAAGNVAILRRLGELPQVTIDIRWATPCAVRHGHCSVLTYIHERETKDGHIGDLFTESDADAAAECGQLRVIELLHGWGVDCTHYGAREAAMGGHLDVLQRLHEWGINCTRRDVDEVAGEGGKSVMDVLRLLHGWGIDCTLRGAGAIPSDFHEIRALLTEWGIAPWGTDPQHAVGGESDVIDDAVESGDESSEE